MTDAEELRLKNRQTFEAEQTGDPKALEQILADEFRIKRASGIVQTRREMVDQVLYGDNPYTSRTVSQDGSENNDADNPKIFGNCAVLSSLLTTEKPGTDGKPVIATFRNIKVFEKKAGKWKCVSWQVFSESS